MKCNWKRIVSFILAAVLWAGALSAGIPAVALAAPKKDGEAVTAVAETGQPEALADVNWITVENDAPEIIYQGTWNKCEEGGHSGGNAHQSDAEGATASFTFQGTGIKWVGQKDINYTKAKVYLDGVLIGMPDANGPAAYQQQIFGMVGIPDGEHTFTIESQGPPNSEHNINFIELDFLAYTNDKTEVQASDLQISNQKDKLYVGDTWQLDVSAVKDSYQVYCGDVTYNSSQPDVAAIDKNGLITAKVKGKTEISVSGKGVTKSFTLEVKEKSIGKLRRVIDSANPLFYHHLYRQHNPSALGQRVDSLQGGLDIQSFWDSLDNAMTPKVKQYQALLIHAGGEINDSEDTRRWYRLQMDKTVKDQIPFFLMISNSYTDVPIDNAWLAEMYETYPNMLGVAYSENHASVWQGHGGYRSEEIASKLELSAEYGGYVIFADTNNYDEYMESTLKNEVLMEAAKKYSDNFIILPKYTSQWSEAGYNSYASVAMGTWLSGYAGNWGSLIDSWQWWDLYYYNDPFRENRVERLGGGEECRHPFSYPELLYPIRMLSEANSGATVFSFEHPMYSTAVGKSEDDPAYTTPAFDNAIVQAMTYMVENHSQTKEQVLAKTKVAFDSCKGTLNKTAEAGVNLIKALYGDENLHHKGDRTDPNEMLMMQLSGRYGFIPSIPELATEADKKMLNDQGIQLIDKDFVLANFKKNSMDEVKAGTDTATQEAVQSYFNNLYPEVSQGKGYVQKIGDTWFTYNNRWTGYPVSSLVQSADLNTTKFCSKTKVNYAPYTYINLKESNNKVQINFNNYFVDKSSVWENYTERWDGDNGLEFKNYLLEKYIPKDKTQDNEFKTASITWYGLKLKPEIKNLTGLAGQYNAPKEIWNAATGEYTIQIEANGYMDFEVVKTFDTSALKAAIHKAGQINRTIYTEVSLKNLDAAVKAGQSVLNQMPDDITQEQINSLTKNINDAIAKLIKQPVSLTALNNAIARGKAVDRKQYTAGSLAVLDQALAAAIKLQQENLDITGQTKVDQAAAAIDTAIKNLVIYDPLPQVGGLYTVGSYKYKVTTVSASAGTVQLVAPIKNTLTKVTIPADVKIDGITFKVTSIGDKAFYNNKKLSAVTIGTNITTLGRQCFYGCGAIKTIRVNSSVLKSVGKDSLKNIYKKAVIEVPTKKVTSYKKLFANKGQQKTVIVKSVPQPLPKKGSVVKVGNYKYKVTVSSAKSGTVQFVGASKRTYTKITVPSVVKMNDYTFKVTSIADKAFYNNKKLASVTLGSYVTTIGKQSFYGCTKLKAIRINSSSVKSVGKDAFKKIDKKATIKVPSKKVTAYKKLLKSKGQEKTVVIKKY